MTEDRELEDRLAVYKNEFSDVRLYHELQETLSSLRGKVEELTRLREEDLLAFEATQMKRDEQNLKLQAKAETAEAKVKELEEKMIEIYKSDG